MRGSFASVHSRLSFKLHYDESCKVVRTAIIAIITEHKLVLSIG